MTTTVYGASDDLIELEGDIYEEFYVLGEEEENYLAFSNGTVLRVDYDKDGVWRIRPMTNLAAVTIDMAPADDESNYSDRATLHEPATWVVHGRAFVRGKEKTP